MVKLEVSDLSLIYNNKRNLSASSDVSYWIGGSYDSRDLAGHRNVFNSYAVREQVDAAIASILTKDTEFNFYSGGMGEFDKLCESAVRSAKVAHTELTIKLVYVSPYMSNSFNTQRDYYEYHYDDILIPMELAGVHYKGAITKRNRWLVDNADYLITYIRRDHGGAYATMRYAERKKSCRIIHIE